MAELTHKERLQPSLLDRLTDDEPGSRVEAPHKRILTASQLRECVRRDLTWLFNTTQLAALDPEVEANPLAACSVVNYGIPDLAGRTASGVDVVVLERMIRQAIWDFEPRLVRTSVVVRGLIDARDMSHNALAFEIEADLWAQPFPLRLSLRTQVDLEDGRFQVSDLGGAAKGA
jgi:type VI secretion system protein ImpF